MHNQPASTLVINYGLDYYKTARAVLDATDLHHRIRRDFRVAIKPNMVLAKPPSAGATTHAEVCAALIEYLRECGVSRIEIIESAWVGADTGQAYRVCGYDALSKRYDVPLYDLKKDSTVSHEAGPYRFDICRRAVEADFLINVPVLKAHCQTKMTGCLKNLKGCIPDHEKRRFHTLGLHKPIAYLNTVIRTDFCLVDAICGDLTFEEGGKPVARHMVYACDDPVLADGYGAELIGYPPEEIAYLSLAAQLGVGRLPDSDTVITELNHGARPVCTPADTTAFRRMACHVTEDGACSACHAALMNALQRLEETGLRNDMNICIGQGFTGKDGALGCGECTRGFRRFVPGCPPSAADIVAFLRQA